MQPTERWQFFILLFLLIFLPACTKTTTEKHKEKASDEEIFAQLDDIFEKKYKFPDSQIHQTFEYKDGINGFFIIIMEKTNESPLLGLAFFENIHDSLNYFNNIKHDYLLKFENLKAFMCVGCNNSLNKDIKIGGENDSNGYIELNETWGPHQSMVNKTIFVYDKKISKWILSSSSKEYGEEYGEEYSNYEKINTEKHNIYLDTFDIEVYE